MFNELPIRTKREMVNDIIEIVHCLHLGRRNECDRFVEDLKARCAYLDERVQQDVMMFVEQVQFQYAYDPWHKVTPDVEAAADRLIEDLGVY